MSQTKTTAPTESTESTTDHVDNADLAESTPTANETADPTPAESTTDVTTTPEPTTVASETTPTTESTSTTPASDTTTEPASTAPEPSSSITPSDPHTAGPASTPKPTKQSHPLLVCLTTLAILLSSTAIGLEVYRILEDQPGQVTVLPATEDGNSVSFKEGSVADIVSKVAPSVVSITTEIRTESWFGEDTSSAAGTGFIVSADGYVVTNKHVVADAKTVNIVLDNGTKFEGVKVLGTDPLNDVAVLKIDNVSDLPAVTLGTSSTLSAGQQVVAIGNALGLYSNTVTSGVVSGTGRTLTATDESYTTYEQLSDMIQTDAAINGGNSGGPLINAAGQVIGINTAYASGNSVGFAIPISAVKGIIRHAIDSGKVERAVIGVQYINLDPSVAREHHLDVTAGAYIQKDDHVFKDTPAAQAGLKGGDIITAVGNTEIGKSGSLATLIGEYTIGDTVKITLLRGGQTVTTEMTLTAYDSASMKNAEDR